MPSLASQVSRNSLVYGTGQVLSRLAALALLMFLSRQLSVEQFGGVMILMAALAIAEIVCAAGLDRVAARGLARDAVGGWDQLPGLVGLASTLGALVAALLLSAAWLMQLRGVSAACLLLIAASIVVVAANAVIDGALQGAQRMAPSACGVALASTVWLCATVTAMLLARPDLNVVFAALLLGQVVRLVYMVHVTPAAWSQLRLLPPGSYALLKEAAPYALAAILGTMLLRQDMLLLGWMRGEQQAALYGSAFRFVELGLFTGMVGLVSLGPALARLHDDSVQLRRAYLSALGVASAAAVAAAVLLYSLAEPLLTLVFSAKYAEAAPVLRLLAFAVAAYLLHLPAMAVLLYARSARGLLGVSAVTTGLSLLLNLSLIPALGAHGAAIAAVASIAAGASLAAALVWRMTRTPAGALAASAARS
jgi:O-antigen/teichoic acid export membrane protein